MKAVLPRRHRSSVDSALRPLLELFHARHPKADTTLIEHAYEVARDAHRDQVRRSGDPYIAHPLGVATILADLGLDDVTLAAALLHDAVEDTSVTIENLVADFGPDLTAIVDGVTKLDRLQFDSREAQQAATMRKMLVAMAKDVRVLLIKLADRLHNMRTIASLPGGEAEADRERDARHLRAARAPARDPGREVAARGPRVRGAAPEALRRDRAHGRERGARTPGRPARGARTGAVAARGAAHRGGGDRTPEALLVHLREDGRARQGVRGDQRSARRTRDRGVGEGLLRRARLDPRVVATGAGPVQGLHRDAEVQPLPVVAHDGRGAAGQAGRVPDPYRRDAPPGRVRRRRALGLQGAAQPHRGSRVDAAARRLADRDQRPGRVHAEPEDRPRAG